MSTELELGTTSIRPFGWRRLTSLSELVHRLDGSGELLIRGEGAAEPFVTAHVRDGHGGFRERPIAQLGYVWTPAQAGDGWTLRTTGEPVTMRRTEKLWGGLARAASAQRGLDERVVLTTIACESGGATPDAMGLVRAPRTEKGYPRRTGESDPGDFDRDAEDWRASRGAHSSHGLMQTLIATAVRARPDLFRDVTPSYYRAVLWTPANSVACGVAYLAGFPQTVLADPLATRFHYGAGSVRPAANRWGAVFYDELVPLSWLAFWNDGVVVRRGRDTWPREPAQAGSQSFAWASGAFDPCPWCTSAPTVLSPDIALPAHPRTAFNPTLLLSAGVLLFGSMLARGAHR